MYSIIQSLVSRENVPVISLYNLLKQRDEPVEVIATCKGGVDVHGELPIVYTPEGFVVRGGDCKTLLSNLQEKFRQ